MCTWEVDARPDGGASVTEHLAVSGQAAASWRQHYQAPGERKDRVTKVWRSRFPGAILEDQKFQGIEDPNQQVTVESRVTLPHFGERPLTSVWHLPVTAQRPHFVGSYAKLSTRKLPLELEYPWAHEEALAYEVPAGWRILEWPATVKSNNAFGRFELQVSPSEDKRRLRIHSAIHISNVRVAPAEYPAFRAFLGTIDAALAGHIVLTKDTP
jgi:hypothetical protein